MRALTLSKHSYLYLTAWFCSFSLLFFFTQSSFAGQTCEEAELNPHKIMQGFELAQKLKLYLDESQASVALVARAGQDLRQYHLRYSHLGIAQKDAQGRWIIMHELNECGTAKSGLFNEGLANFFMDDPFQYESLILIPQAQFQEKILATLNSPIAKNLHFSQYNMLAFPFSMQYQNSNQWVLEVLASALSTELASAPSYEDIANYRIKAQSWLQSNQYQPDTISLSALTRLGARLFKANISFDDHPFGRRMAGKIDTVTVESVARFLQKQDALLSQKTINQP
jgi:hypothetical protein